MNEQIEYIINEILRLQALIRLQNHVPLYEAFKMAREIGTIKDELYKVGLTDEQINDLEDMAEA